MALIRKCIICNRTIGIIRGKQDGITGAMCTKCFAKRIRRLQLDRGETQCFRTVPNCSETECRYYVHCIK